MSVAIFICKTVALVCILLAWAYVVTTKDGPTVIRLRTMSPEVCRPDRARVTTMSAIAVCMMAVVTMM